MILQFGLISIKPAITLGVRALAVGLCLLKRQPAFDDSVCAFESESNNFVCCHWFGLVWFGCRLLDG